jgi:N-acetylneuraminate synthase/N,N'-diacetyllegionaminate synthase
MSYDLEQLFANSPFSRLACEPCPGAPSPGRGGRARRLNESNAQPRTLVIAEIGVNHDGSLDRALKLVRIASFCGADAVKLQIFRADALMHGSSSFATYQKAQTQARDPAAMLRQYELPPAHVRRIVDAIREHSLIPIATPFSLPDVDAISDLNLPAIKLASPDLVNHPLLLRAAALGKPLLISTGAATVDEVTDAVTCLRDCGATFALLHCISSYPTADADANLCWITELADRFDSVPIGYSDHTTDPMAGALAVAAGARIIEKHLTYDRAAPGPDHAASADGDQFADYVRLIRRAECLRGLPGKRLLDAEQDVRRVSRQSLVLSRALRAGEALRADHLMIQRPGTGIPAACFQRVLHRRAARALQAGTLLQWDMLTEANVDAA